MQTLLNGVTQFYTEIRYGKRYSNSSAWSQIDLRVTDR